MFIRYIAIKTRNRFPIKGQFRHLVPKYVDEENWNIERIVSSSRKYKKNPLNMFTIMMK